MSLSDFQSSATTQKHFETVVSHAVTDDAQQVFLVWYSDQPALEHQIVQLDQLLQAQLAVVQIETQSWQVTKISYRHLACDSGNCCPADGNSVVKLEDTAIRAALVYRGYSAAQSRDSYLTIPPAAANLQLAAQQAAQHFMARKASVSKYSWRQEAFAAWLYSCEQARRQHPATPEQLGVLSAGMTDLVVRDAILLSLVPDGLAVARGMLTDHRAASAAARQLLEPIARPRAAHPPCPEFSRTAATVLHAVVAHAGDREQAAPLTLLAFLAWWLGDGTRASYRLSEALTLAPSYKLALLLSQAVHQTVRPGLVAADALEPVA